MSIFQNSIFFVMGPLLLSRERWVLKEETCNRELLKRQKANIILIRADYVAKQEIFLQNSWGFLKIMRKLGLCLMV